MNTADLTFGLWYDFRNPERWRRPFSTLYREVLDQIAWAEQLGIGSVWLGEHHFAADGYSPSPLTLAAAIGERTRALRIGTNLMVATLHHPVQLAEEAATLSLLTDGRFDLGVGQGYREVEFEAFGRNIRHRPSLLEEGVAVMRRAWSGDTEPFVGKRFQLPAVSVTPVPERAPRIFVGAHSLPGIERAARIGDGFLDSRNRDGALYLDALDRLGRDRAQGAIYAGQYAVIAEDPEREWARIGPHALYQMNTYLEWGAVSRSGPVAPYTDPDALLRAGTYRLWDPAAAVDALTDLLCERPQIKDLHFWAQLPGEPVDSGSARVELLATQVMPKVRERLAVEPAC